MDTNYRLTVLIELDTDSSEQAERWSREVTRAIADAVPTLSVGNVELALVDEFGDEVRP